MNGKWLELGIGLVVAIAAILANNKSIKYMIKESIDPIMSLLHKHTEALEMLQIDYELTNTNRVFFKKLDKIIDIAIGVVREKESSANSVNEATCYLFFFGDRYKDSCGSVLSKGIDEISNDSYSTLIASSMRECKLRLNSLFGKEFTNEYIEKYKIQRQEYVDAVCKISDDWINSHDERFRNISLVYLQEFVNNFIRFYFNYKKD